MNRHDKFCIICGKQTSEYIEDLDSYGFSVSRQPMCIDCQWDEALKEFTKDCKEAILSNNQ